MIFRIIYKAQFLTFINSTLDSNGWSLRNSRRNVSSVGKIWASCYEWHIFSALNSVVPYGKKIQLILTTNVQVNFKEFQDEFYIIQGKRQRIINLDNLKIINLDKKIKLRVRTLLTLIKLLIRLKRDLNRNWQWRMSSFDHLVINGPVETEL